MRHYRSLFSDYRSYNCVLLGGDTVGTVQTFFVVASQAFASLIAEEREHFLVLSVLKLVNYAIAL